MAPASVARMVRRDMSAPIVFQRSEAVIGGGRANPSSSWKQRTPTAFPLVGVLSLCTSGQGRVEP